MSDSATARQILDEHGTTFAAEAGIDLRDEPGPLWQLFVLAQLLSTRISSSVAVATARELTAAGWTTPRDLLGSTWNQRVAALGRGGYRRYDFSTATRLADNATLLLDRWGGDLRALRDEAVADADAGDGGPDPARVADGVTTRLREFTGIGPAGANIFVREAQAVWPQVRPHVDDLVREGAAAAGLPTDATALAALVEDDEFARLTAGLVRYARAAARSRRAARR